MIYAVGAMVFFLLLLVSLIGGAVPVGGSPMKPLLVHRRRNPAGYVAVLLFLAALVAFCGVEGASELGWLPAR